MEVVIVSANGVAQTLQAKTGEYRNIAVTPAG